MALVLKDRVKETTTTVGTGTVTLAGASSGYQAFSVIGDTNTTYYAIVGATDWEVGLGTYTLSGTTLARTTVLASSTGGTAVSFSAGSKDVFVTYPADLAVLLSATQTLTNKTVTNLVCDGSVTEDVYAIVDGASVDLNPANGTVQTWTLGANRTATAASFAAGQSMTIMINDGTAYALTWPTTTWVGGYTPILATTGYTVIELWKINSTLYGTIVGYAA